MLTATLALGLVVLVPVVLHLVRRRADTFDVFIWASGYFFLIFVLRSVYVVTYGSPFLGSAPFDESTVRAWGMALILLAAAFLLFALGYHAAFGRVLARAIPALPRDWNLKRSQWVIVICTAIAGAAMLVLVDLTGGWAAYLGNKRAALTAGGTTYVLMAVSLVQYALTIGAIWALRAHRLRLTSWVFLLPLVVGYGIVSGSKGDFLMPFLSLLLVYHYLVRRVGLRELVLLGLIAVAVFPLFNAFRHAGSPSLEAILGQASRVMGNPTAFLQTVMSRFHDMDAVIVVLRDTPATMDYQYGATLLPVVTAWVPRLLWPGKPVVSFGRVFAETYFGSVYGGTSTSASVTVLGEGYINLHIAGFLWLALAVGIGLRMIREYSLIRVGGMTGLFVYATLFESFMVWEANLAGFVTRLLVTLLIVVVLTLTMGRRGSVSDSPIERPDRPRSTMGADVD